MIDYIDNNDKKQLAGKQGYNDKPQRDAFKRMASEGGCEVTRNYLVDYFKLDMTNEEYYISSDPLGNNKVDLGIFRKRDNKVMGLVEVDVINKWIKDWPYPRTGVVNRLLRKEPYYENMSLPYVNISFNVSGTDGVMTNKETHAKYPLTEWYVPEVKKMEKGRRIKHEDTIKIGRWAMTNNTQGTLEDYYN